MESHHLAWGQTIPKHPYFLFAGQEQFAGVVTDRSDLRIHQLLPFNVGQPRFQFHQTIRQRFHHLAETEQVGAQLLLERGARGGAGHRAGLVLRNFADGIDAELRVHGPGKSHDWPTFPGAFKRLKRCPG